MLFVSILFITCQSSHGYLDVFFEHENHAYRSSLLVGKPWMRNTFKDYVTCWQFFSHYISNWERWTFWSCPGQVLFIGIASKAARCRRKSYLNLAFLRGYFQWLIPCRWESSYRYNENKDQIITTHNCNGKRTYYHISGRYRNQIKTG